MFETIGRCGAAIRQAHRRRKTIRCLSNLPPEIQKDIGWPVAAHSVDQVMTTGYVLRAVSR
ncbi:MAG: hypothetical protein WA975_15325 [Mesorhizobium sp.]